MKCSTLKRIAASVYALNYLYTFKLRLTIKLILEHEVMVNITNYKVHPIYHLIFRCEQQKLTNSHCKWSTIELTD